MTRQELQTEWLKAYCYVFVNEDTYGMSMGVRSLESDDLSDGNEIKVDPYKGGEDE